MANPAVPVETKVAAAASSSTVTGVITWILVSYIPAWHDGLPAALAAFLPLVVAVVSGAVSGYLAPHTPRDLPASQPSPSATSRQ